MPIFSLLGRIHTAAVWATLIELFSLQSGWKTYCLQSLKMAVSTAPMKVKLRPHVQATLQRKVIYRIDLVLVVQGVEFDQWQDVVLKNLWPCCLEMSY